jgi:hypothetical protein
MIPYKNLHKSNNSNSIRGAGNDKMGTWERIDYFRDFLKKHEKFF